MGLEWLEYSQFGKRILEYQLHFDQHQACQLFVLGQLLLELTDLSVYIVDECFEIGHKTLFILQLNKVLLQHQESLFGLFELE